MVPCIYITPTVAHKAAVVAACAMDDGVTYAVGESDCVFAQAYEAGRAALVFLAGDFDKEYFTKIDIRVDKEIKLYSKSAKILTNHPSSAYTLQPDANKQYVLRITDPQSFWSTSKYLVILVK